MNAAVRRSSTLATQGVELHFEEWGTGQPLLLLHGFFGSGRDFEPFADTFRAERCIVPDLRGHGRSTNPQRTFSHTQAAADVQGLLDHLGIERCRAIGVSAGANVLLRLAAQDPSRFTALVLVSATTHFPERARAFMDAYTLESRSDEELAQLRRVHSQADEQVPNLFAMARALKDQPDDQAFDPATLAEITARTLLVYGDRDPLYPLEIGVELYRSIRNARLWVIPGAGHTPIFSRAERARFLNTATSFLAD